MSSRKKQQRLESTREYIDPATGEFRSATLYDLTPVFSGRPGRWIAAPSPEEAIEDVARALDDLCGQQSRQYVQRRCDDIVRDYGEFEAVRKAFGEHPRLREAFVARAKGMRWDAIEEKYVFPEIDPSDPPEKELNQLIKTAKAPKLRTRLKQVSVHPSYNDLALAEQRAREDWKWESHGRRHKGQPEAPGLADLADKAQGRSKLLPAKPAEASKTLAEVLAQLPERQRIVYEARVIADPPRSLANIARELGNSEKNVNKLEKKARRNVERLLRGGGG